MASTRTLTFEDFEEQCRPGAELLEEELHALKGEDWNLVFDLSGRPLFKWRAGENALYMGIVIALKGGDWDMPLLRLAKKKQTLL